MDEIEEAFPADFSEETTVCIPRHPNEDCLTDNMVFRYKTPEAGIGRIMAIVTHHEEIILFESVLSDFFSIDEKKQKSRLYSIIRSATSKRIWATG